MNQFFFARVFRRRRQFAKCLGPSQRVRSPQKGGPAQVRLNSVKAAALNKQPCLRQVSTCTGAEIRERAERTALLSFADDFLDEMFFDAAYVHEPDTDCVLCA